MQHAAIASGKMYHQATQRHRIVWFFFEDVRHGEFVCFSSHSLLFKKESGNGIHRINILTVVVIQEHGKLLRGSTKEELVVAIASELCKMCPEYLSHGFFRFIQVNETVNVDIPVIRHGYHVYAGLQCSGGG